jgi:hypothetical protein
MLGAMVDAVPPQTTQTSDKNEGRGSKLKILFRFSLGLSQWE